MRRARLHPRSACLPGYALRRAQGDVRGVLPGQGGGVRQLLPHRVAAGDRAHRGHACGDEGEHRVWRRGGCGEAARAGR